MEIPGIWKNVHDGALIGKQQDSSDTDAPSQGALTIPAPKMFCLTGPVDQPKRVSSSFFPFVHGGVGWGGQQRSFRPQEKTEQGRKVKRFYAAVPDEIIIWPLASTPAASVLFRPSCLS